MERMLFRHEFHDFTTSSLCLRVLSMKDGYMANEYDGRRKARLARRRREEQLRRRMLQAGGIIIICLAIMVGVLVIGLNRKTVETGSAVSREGLERLLQKAEAIEVYAYPSAWTDELEDTIAEVEQILAESDLTDVEINSAYSRLLDCLQLFSGKEAAGQRET